VNLILGGGIMGRRNKYSQGEYEDVSPEQLKMLQELMALQFSVLEFNLYLNTHPCDKEALEEHYEHANQLREIRRAYQEKYGPILPMHSDQYAWYPKCDDEYYNWQYIETPWPWKINYNC
jgi:spore coat protein JB